MPWGIIVDCSSVALGGLLGGTLGKYFPQRICDYLSKFFGITPKNLFECFVDTDCEFLIDRLLERGSYIRQSAGTSGKYYYDCCYGTGIADF